jgi:hypothetical protein
MRQKAAARGAQGTRWLRGLGDVIEQLEHDWDVVVGAALHGGSAIPMREWSSELLEGNPARLGRERSGLLGHLTGVDTRAIWEWGFVERVSTGLLVMQVGAEHVGRQMLEVAQLTIGCSRDVLMGALVTQSGSGCSLIASRMAATADVGANRTPTLADGEGQAPASRWAPTGKTVNPPQDPSNIP